MINMKKIIFLLLVGGGLSFATQVSCSSTESNTTKTIELCSDIEDINKQLDSLDKESLRYSFLVWLRGVKIKAVHKILEKE